MRSNRLAGRRKRFMYWLWDGWPYEHKPLWFVRLVSWAGCKMVGHEPIADQCGRPEHDFCAWCRKPTPNRAPRRPQIREVRDAG
jgi:hypothetical protein